MMGRTSNTARQRWNAAHYTQVKVSVSPEIANAFKAACQAEGVSMAGVLERYMTQYSGVDTDVKSRPAVPVQPTVTALPQKDLAVTIKTQTLNDRRKVMAMICRFVRQLFESEEGYIARMPMNLKNGDAYELATERMDRLEDLLDSAEGIY